MLVRVDTRCIMRRCIDFPSECGGGGRGLDSDCVLGRVVYRPPIRITM